MSNIFRVSQSKVKLYRKCLQAYEYRYRQKLRSKRKARPLLFGSIAHKMIEAHANSEEPFEVLGAIEREQGKMFRSQQEELGDIISDVRCIMTDYFAYWGDKPLNYVRMRGKASEHSFEVDVGGGIFVEGKFDNFAKTPNKLTWLVEHKTGKAIPNDDHRWRDLQSSVYIRIAEMLSLPVKLDGTCWDYIRSKPPTAPQLLKNGQMSKRGIDTLPSRVSETLKEHGLKEKDFKPLMTSAISNRSSYFQRIFTPVKANVVDLLFSDFLETARQIANDDKGRAKNIGRHCDWCEFETLCRAELQGSDINFLKKKEYERHERPSDLEVDFEG